MVPLIIEQIIQFIADFGITLVICAVFIYVVIRAINLLFSYIENKLATKRHDKLLDVRNDINEKVQLILDVFLEEHHGDRIQVIEFSNSVMSVAYLPFKYMTCTYEVYRAGKAAIGNRIDHLSTSLFTVFFTTLQSNPYCILDGAATRRISGGAMCDLLISSGEPTALCTILRTIKGKSIGYVVMKKSEFTQTDIEDIQSLADHLSSLLGIADK